jgi:hypothetical protein
LFLSGSQNGAALTVNELVGRALGWPVEHSQCRPRRISPRHEINVVIGFAGSDLDKKLGDAVAEAKSSAIRAILLRPMSLHAADSEDQFAVSALRR